MPRIVRFSLFLLLFGTTPLAGQDTIPPVTVRAPIFSSRDAAMLGVTALGTVLLFAVDRSIAEGIQDSTFQDRAEGVGDMAANIKSGSIKGLAAVGAGAYLVGRIIGVRELADLGLHGAEAVLLTQGLGVLIKGVSGRARPNVDITRPHDFDPGAGFSGTRRGSFPSTYAILTFTSASVLLAETSRWWPGGVWIVGPTTFGAASLVGFSRMYTNRHWASDVFLAAGLGTWVGWKVVRLHHDHPDNPIDRFLLPSVAPEPGGGARIEWKLPMR